MPSTTSSSVSRPLASSTVMTPSLPTFCMALAIMSPISRSPLAAMEPTWPISSEVEIFFERFFTSSTTESTARSMPRFRSIGFMPAATARTPSRTIAWASTVAVVVPSPAMSLVLLATSRTIWAPMFSNLSASSISLATVTPSLVIRGAPNDLSSTTLRPLGPNVTRTAFARMSMPRNMRSRASPLNLTSFAAIVDVLLIYPVTIASGDLLDGGFLALEHAEDVALLHDDELLAVELDLGARPLPEQDAVAGLDVERVDLAVVAAHAAARRHHLALLGLFLRRVRDDDPAGGLVVLLHPAHQHPVMQRTEAHRTSPLRGCFRNRNGELLALAGPECQDNTQDEVSAQVPFDTRPAGARSGRGRSVAIA